MGVYDEDVVESNSPDFVATGSHFTDAEFGDLIEQAFAMDAGGVINGTLLTGAFEFGASASKTLHFLSTLGTSWGIGAPTTSVYPISETGAFASSSVGGYRFTAFSLEVIDGAADEAVVAIGVTTLSARDRNYGNVTVTGVLESGGSVSASRVMSEGPGLGDTFFGLQAPSGDHFTRLELRYSGADVPDRRLWFDDIGFITSSFIPEPTSGGLIGLGLLSTAVQRRRWRQRG